MRLLSAGSQKLLSVPIDLSTKAYTFGVFMTSRMITSLMGVLIVFAALGCTEGTDNALVSPSSGSTSAISTGTSQSPSSKASGRDTPRSDKPQLATVSSGIFQAYADLDGDDLVEHVEICEERKVCVTAGSSASQRIYTEPQWETVSLLAVQDTNGEPGAEIVVMATNQDGVLECVCIVHYPTPGVERYVDRAWHHARVITTLDADGVPGDDIVLTAFDEAGKLQCLCVIHDRQRAFQAYFDSSWSTVNVSWFADTDGKSGTDIIFEARDSGGNLRCVCVVHDSSSLVVPYFNTAWTGAAVFAVVDTDGTKGAEIIVTYASPSEGGVTVIHDSSQGMNSYPFSTDIPMVQLITNLDKLAGDEICLKLSSDERFALINDRNKELKLIDACTLPVTVGNTT